MEESIIRELYRFQDMLYDFVPKELWRPWAEANENILAWWKEKKENEE